MFGKKHMIKWLLAAFAIETLCSTYGLKIASHTGLVSFIYFIAGAAIPLIILFISPRQTQMPALTTNRFAKFFRWIVFILMMVF